MLKPDLYLRVVFTIVAVALLWVGFTLNTRPVQAQASAQRVIITGIELPGSGGVLPVGISALHGRRSPRVIAAILRSRA